jgi:hypothetical protein
MITVEIGTHLTDNTSTIVTKTFMRTGSYWLDDDDIYNILKPGTSMYDIFIRAETNQVMTDAIVTVDLYGY